MPLGRAREPFSHPDWIFEVKWDGFRSLVRIEHGACKLVSRNGNEFKSFSVLSKAIPTEIQGRSAVLDGEIVCLDADGKPQFRDLLFRRGEPRFVAFDLLWCEGEDLRYLPLIDRKRRLHSVVRNGGDRLLYCDHQSDPYLEGHATWLKIRNRDYSQWAGREELFERERGGDPDFQVWDGCALACNSGEM